MKGRLLNLSFNSNGKQQIAKYTVHGEKAVRYIIEDYIEQHFGDEFLISDLKLLANEIEQQPKQVAIMILDKVSELKQKYLENGICPDCGHEIKFGDKRCLSCGIDLF